MHFSQKINFPSADRNKSFILEVLKENFDAKINAKVLEIASGTGQHVSYFAESFPNFEFQPSENDSSLLSSIKAYGAETSNKNVNEPLHIDIAQPLESWGLKYSEWDYMININMIHVSPIKCTEKLFENAGKLLKNHGLMVTYGALGQDGRITPQSNVDFNKTLLEKNPEWGIRDLKDITAIAESCNLKLLKFYDLPANNKCLVWQKGI